MSISMLSIKRMKGKKATLRNDSIEVIDYDDLVEPIETQPKRRKITIV